MINKSAFTKITKKVMRSQKGMRDPKLVHPQREWTTGVFIALVVLIGAAAWSGTTYVKYQNIELSMGQGSESEVVVYRESLVNASLAVFAERQQRLDQLMGNLGSIPAEEVVVETPVSTSTDESTLPSLDTASSTTEEVESEEVPENVTTPVESDVSSSSPETEPAAGQPPTDTPINPSPTFEL